MFSLLPNNIGAISNFHEAWIITQFFLSIFKALARGTVADLRAICKFTHLISDSAPGNWLPIIISVPCPTLYVNDVFMRL